MRDRQHGPVGLIDISDLSPDVLSKVDNPALRSAIASRQSDNREPAAGFDNFI
ncbi:hypothetical protein [Nonomuraea sp. SYSU D8015]|uniref:hypothetical protein n=1 Tax=Nonomuraea sp. SYSU D8015 TaxID=2593644 RepID=UPI00166085B4|nr:hypothetical protein [Nonomuraea sp. SYSU D8015]